MNPNPDLDELADELENLFAEFFPTRNKVCLEPTCPPSQALKLRASASEFVPKSDLQVDSQCKTKERDEDNSYDSLTDASEYTNISANNRTKNGQNSNSKYNIRRYERQNQYSPCCSSNIEKRTPQPPPELANGLPHFKGPYMPLIRHRMANAEAYGLIKGAKDFSNNSLLMQNLIQQLSQLDSFKDLDSLSIDLANLSPFQHGMSN